MDTDPDAPVLIFDGDRPCSVAAVALRRLEGVAAVPWEADPVGPFLDAQFRLAPVRDGARRPRRGTGVRRPLGGRGAGRARGGPKSSAGLVRDNYDRIAGVVGTLSGRGRDPDDVHETYRLTDAASDLVDGLRLAAGERPAGGAVVSGGQKRGGGEATRSTAIRERATRAAPTLLVELAAPATIEVGALGDRRFEPGIYAYTGSALGTGVLPRRPPPPDRPRRTRRAPLGTSTTCSGPRRPDRQRRSERRRRRGVCGRRPTPSEPG